MPKAGSLFIDLGVKGGDKAIGTLSGIIGVSKDVQSNFLAAKAALVGFIYEFANLAGVQNSFSMSLRGFENLTELSGEKMQRWVYIMRLMGVSAEETQQNIVSLFKNIGKIQLGKNVPEGFLAIVNKVGLSTQQVNQIRGGDAFLLADVIRRYRETTRGEQVAPAVASFIQSMGLTDRFSGALNDPKLKRLSDVPAQSIYTKTERKGMDTTFQGLQEFESKWEHIIGRISAAIGPDVVKSLNDFTDALIRLFGVLKNMTLETAEKKVIEGGKGLWEGAKIKIMDAITNRANIGTPVVAGLQYLRPDQLASIAIHNNITVKEGDIKNPAEFGLELGKSLNSQIEHTFRTLNSSGTPGGH